MIEASELAEPTDLAVGEYLEQWLAHVRGRVRATTYEGYEALLRLHGAPRLGHIPLRHLRPLHIQRAYAELLQDPRGGARGRLSAKTVGNLHRVLRQAFGQALRWQLISSNPAAAAEPPRARPPQLAVVDQDLAWAILRASAGTRFECPVAIAVSTGMRRGEILGLRWSDVDSDLTVARVRRSLQPTADGLVFEEPKTARSRRAVALPAFLRAYLVRQREAQGERRAAGGAGWRDLDLLIDGGVGGPWHPDNFSAAWPRFLARKGLPRVRFHDLRHAHATLMLLQGVHPKVVSERLGHSSIGITLDTYSHVLPSMQAEAASAFDRLFAGSA